jgi:DNA-binding transcriptional LysR family regulator
MDLNLRDVRAFVAVAQTGSFTRAATRLHLSQPALTVQIRRLEEIVGVRLFDRNSRNVALTPAGRELLPVLQKSLHDMEQVLVDARALADGSSGTVRIACLPTFAASLLPDLIRDLRKTVPRAGFHVRDVVASMVNTLVRNEEVDIGLTGGETLDSAFDVLYSGVDGASDSRISRACRSCSRRRARACAQWSTRRSRMRAARLSSRASRPT